jgi:hypothetical protein
MNVVMNIYVFFFHSAIEIVDGIEMALYNRNSRWHRNDIVQL